MPIPASPLAPPLRKLLPGIALCIAVTVIAVALQAAEHALLGKAWLEALVLAIIAGTVVRSLWSPSETWHAGIAFGARWPLEIAVVLLGASVSAATIQTLGPILLIGISLVVASAIVISLTLGKLLGLPTRLALLVACGNSICGNSAIAAVAPVINADSDDVAAAIAFTAVLGVAVVIGLPLLGLALGMSATRYGAFAGLTVYAVPQVLAAAAPFGAKAVQIGTLVKLVRVLMLGPVCIVLSLLAPRLADQPEPAGAVVAGEQAKAAKPGFAQLVPWFIIGFVVLAACRTLGLIPDWALGPLATVATGLTVVSMAALGLGTDVHKLVNAGQRTIVTVVLSLAALGAISGIAVRLIG